MVVPDDVFRRTLAQNRQHDAYLLVILLLGPETLLAEHFLHFVRVDGLQLVNWYQRASLILCLILLKVFIDQLLRHLLGRRLLDDLGTDDGLLHEVSIEARIAQLRDYLDELLVAVLRDI